MANSLGMRSGFDEYTYNPCHDVYNCYDCQRYEGTFQIEFNRIQAKQYGQNLQNAGKNTKIKNDCTYMLDNSCAKRKVIFRKQGKGTAAATRTFEWPIKTQLFPFKTE